MSQLFWTFYEDQVWRQPLLGSVEALKMNRGNCGNETDSTPAMIGITDNYAILITGATTDPLPDSPVYAAPLFPASGGDPYGGARSFFYAPGFTPDGTTWFPDGSTPSGHQLVQAPSAVITLGGDTIAMAGEDGVRVGSPVTATQHATFTFANSGTYPVGSYVPRGFALDQDGLLSVVFTGLLTDGTTNCVFVSEKFDPAALPATIQADAVRYTYDGANRYKAAAGALSAARGVGLAKGTVFVPFAVLDSVGGVYRRGKTEILLLGPAVGSSTACYTLPDSIYGSSGAVNMAVYNATLTWSVAGSALSYNIVPNSAMFDADGVVGDYAYSAGSDGAYVPSPIPAFWTNFIRTIETI